MVAPSEISLIAFDVDGTLVQHPEHRVIWELLNRRFTGSDETSVTRHRAFREGRLAYDTWVELDIRDWIAGGATRRDIVEEVQKLEVLEAVHETLAALHARGYRLAIISGTLDVVIEEHFPEHPFQAVYTNRLEFDADARLVGWTATPYDQEGKAHALDLLAERYRLPASACAFVGDDHNDCAVARRAGFSVAWNPKCREIEEAATCVARGPSLARLLEIFRGPEASAPGRA